MPLVPSVRPLAPPLAPLRVRLVRPPELRASAGPALGLEVRVRPEQAPVLEAEVPVAEEAPAPRVPAVRDRGPERAAGAPAEPPVAVRVAGRPEAVDLAAVAVAGPAADRAVALPPASPAASVQALALPGSVSARERALAPVPSLARPGLVLALVPELPLA